MDLHPHSASASMSRIATVFLATGVQGTSAVQALIKDGTFTPRAVTRNANSDAARALAALGAEVVEATYDDKEAIKRAVTGAECVFLVRIVVARCYDVTSFADQWRFAS